jgi:hypothetical protein
MDRRDRGRRSITTSRRTEMNQTNTQTAVQSAAIGGGIFAFLNTIVQAISQVGANVFV